MEDTVMNILSINEVNTSQSNVCWWSKWSMIIKEGLPGCVLWISWSKCCWSKLSMMIKYVCWWFSKRINDDQICFLIKKVLPESPHQHLLLRSVPVASLQAEILIVFGDYHYDHNDDDGHDKDDNGDGEDGDFEYKNDDDD